MRFIKSRFTSFMGQVYRAGLGFILFTVIMLYQIIKSIFLELRIMAANLHVQWQKTTFLLRNFILKKVPNWAYVCTKTSLGGILKCY
jgi:hypothetical protein